MSEFAKTRAAVRAPFVLAFVLASLLAAMPPAVAAEPASAAGPVEQVGAYPSSLVESRRFLEIDPTARRLFEIGQESGKPGMSVLARDLDTMRPAGRVDVPESASGVGGFLSAVDELRHRLFVLYPVATAAAVQVRDVLGAELGEGVVDEASRTLFAVAVVDTLRMRLLGRATIALAQPAVPQDRSASNGIGIKAMSFHRDGGRDLIYLASEVPAGVGTLVAGTHSVSVHQLDVARLLDPSSGSAVDWSYAIPQCGLLMARDTTGIVFRSALTPTISVACRQGGAQGLVAGQPAQVPGIVRITLPGGAAQPSDTTGFRAGFHAISGNLQYGVAAVDPLAERILVQIDGSTTEAGVWIFDVPRGAYVGLVSLPSIYAQGGTTALAVDPSLARMYAVSRPDPDSLRSSVLLAATDAPQADQGTLASFAPRPTPSKRRAVVDPATHRIFVASSEGFLVVRDRMPARPRTAAADPDANTLDVAESARTDVNFVGGAQAYGARVRFVGGLRGVDRNTNTVLENPPQELSPNSGGIAPPPPAQGTRDLHLARVLHTTLSNAEASAKATGAQRDLENTDADASGATEYVRRWGGPDLASQRWPYPDAECTDFGGRDDVRESRKHGAAVTCKRAARSVDALAVDESLAQGGVVRIARSSARSVVARDARRGVVAIAEAEARGVELGGVAGIGRVLTRAETWATGRPRASNGVGAGSRFVRTFEDVWVRAADGTRRVVCAATCDPLVVRDAVNRALGLRARVDVPDPEPARAAGTRGGFEALVVRDPLERANESAVNEEADDRRLEVPAMTITVFADGRVPSRAVVSLAGVSAESHYGIFLVQQPVAFRPPREVRAPRANVPGFGALPPPAVGPEPKPGAIRQLFRSVFDGLRFVAAQPAKAARVFALFLLLAAPLVLLMRRRILDRGGDA